MSRKRKTQTVIIPSTSCRVAGCGLFLTWQPHPTKPEREMAVCNCHHAIHHNQTVAERPMAVSKKENELNDSTE